jgi:DNA-binding NarL/FixJ family response regulator
VKVALIGTDLMDRSRITAALADTQIVEPDSAEIIVVDIARALDQVATTRGLAPRARIVCFGPHVDDAAADAARAAGADIVLPRSKFFRDISAAVAAAT